VEYSPFKVITQHLYSPVKDYVVVNDRWGHGDLCKNGGYFTCHDHYNPGVNVLMYKLLSCFDGKVTNVLLYMYCIVGVLQKFKWEDATTIQKGSWGYQRNTDINGYFTTDQLIDLLVTVVRYRQQAMYNCIIIPYGHCSFSKLYNNEL